MIRINGQITTEEADAIIARIQYAEAVAKTPGVTVNECREAIGLTPWRDDPIGTSKLNLPSGV